MKRVLFICYTFPPAAGTTVYRNTFMAKYLAELGYEIVVLMPEVAAYQRDPLGYGVDASLLKELPDALRIYRVPACQPFGLLRLLKKLKLLWAYSFFVRPDERLSWCAAAIPAALRVARHEEIDLIYQSPSPWSTSLVGYVLKSVLQKPLVYDIQDPWMQWAMGSWPTRAHYLLERRLEGIILDKADGISMTGEGYKADLLRDQPHLDAEKIMVIPNGYDTKEPVPRPGAGPTRGNGPLRIVHAGKFYDTWGSRHRGPASAALKTAYDSTLGRLRYTPRPIDNSTAGPRFLLEGLARLRKRNPQEAERIRIEFIGNLHPNVRAQVEELNLADLVTLPGRLPHDTCVERLFQADALFLPFCRYADRSPMAWLPFKLYEYMLTGKPVLAAVPEGDLKETLRRAGTAIFVAQDDPDDFAAALRRLASEHIAGGIRIQPDWAYIRQFQYRALAERMAQLLENAAERACRRRS